MRNFTKLLGITALAAVIGFSIIACDNGTGGGGGGRGPGVQTPTVPLPEIYVSYDTDGKKYELKITQAATAKAVIIRALDPNKNYTYELTITPPGSKSTGTVSNVAGGVLTLQPSNQGAEPFTATVSGSNITNLSGTITLIDDTTVDAPTEELTPNPGGEQPGGEQPVGTEGLAYTLINNDTAYSVSAGTARSGAVVIPASYNGKPVTEIGDNAFQRLTNLTSVTIPSSVTSIGAQAFLLCESLTSITIPASVTSIGEWAFSQCYNLTSITIPEGVTSIGFLAFLGCTSLTSITVDSGNANYSSDGGILYNKAKTTLWTSPEKVDSKESP